MNLLRGLAGIVFLLICIENAFFAYFLSSKRIYRYQDVQSRFFWMPGFLQKFLKIIFVEPLFLSLQLIGILAAMSLCFESNISSIGYLLFLFFINSVRCLGPINGGSDSMAVVILTGLLIGLKNERVGLLYIVAQSSLSYFLAGWVKLKNKSWRSGTALETFLGSPFYLAPRNIYFKHQWFVLSWFIIAFEILFPLGFFLKNLWCVFIFFGFIFHLLNFRFFALNRFFWLWVTTYVAMIQLMG